MKLRSREINVFSMSALDLFASAMGAFMFLAIIALPFFPNTGDSDASVEALKAEFKKNKAELEAAKQTIESTQAQLEKAKQDLEEGINKLPIELVIAIDKSGSMAVPLQRLKDAIARLTVELPKVTDELKIGIISYGGDGNFSRIDTQVINNSTQAQFNRQVNAIELEGGDTDVLEAVTEAIKMFSQPNSKTRKAFVLIGDVGPYERIGDNDFDIYNIPQSRIQRLIRNGQDLPVNKSYETQVFSQVESFIETHKLRSVMAMYTGNATRRGDESYPVIALTKNNSTAFFRQLSEIGGEENGHYSEEPADMLSMLLIAVMSAN